MKHKRASRSERHRIRNGNCSYCGQRHNKSTAPSCGGHTIRRKDKVKTP